MTPKKMPEKTQMNLLFCDSKLRRRLGPVFIARRAMALVAFHPAEGEPPPTALGIASGGQREARSRHLLNSSSASERSSLKTARPQIQTASETMQVVGMHAEQLRLFRIVPLPLLQRLQHEPGFQTPDLLVQRAGRPCIFPQNRADGFRRRHPADALRQVVSLDF